jgi:hypothetical protein
MGINNKDKNHVLGTLFFIILFSLFVLNFQDESENRASDTDSYYLLQKQVFDTGSLYPDQTAFVAFNLNDHYKNYAGTLHNSDFNFGSLQNKLSCFNSKINQDFIYIQKTRLIIKPLFHWMLFYPASPGPNDDLPVLS